MQVKIKSSINHVMSILMDNETIDLDITYKPNEYNDGDAIVNKSEEGKVHLSYLTHDDSAGNPLDCDGMGQIYTSHRHSTTHCEMQQALGLDDNWQPDLYHSASLEILATLILKSLKSDKPLRARLSRLQQKHRGKSDVNLTLLEACNDMNDSVDFEDQFSRHFTGEYYVHNLKENERNTIKELAAFAVVNVKAAWEEAKSQGLIGDPFAMRLDCYQHSGTSYSLAGTGMQCRFDTSSGVAVWVPDGEALTAIKIQTCEALGMKIETRQICCIGILPEHNKPWVLAVKDQEFSAWSDATEYALSFFEPAAVREKQLEIARKFCESSLEDYNSWLNGDCYGIVHMTFIKDGDDWQEESEDVNWGVVGYSNALKEMKVS